ncbi:MAG: putative toxin-antitoxin system toxin component, PIN family [Alphaproteobacteria bacterium]|nr:putative toxin-antitoxin system toxin component, PIN family [Alphaproteobacteria bacterium]
MVDLIPRCVIDTNVFVSGIVRPRGIPLAIMNGLIDGRFANVTCHHILGELARVLTLKFRMAVAKLTRPCLSSGMHLN